MTDTPKKEKKDKKDKKDKKEKKKDKKRIVSLGEAVEPANFRSSDEYLDNERFKPVRNPSFNPALISPLTSPTSSIHSTTKTDEKWIITSNRSRDSLPAVRPESPLTPAELQGFASSKYVPSAGYAHLDPTKHKNAHSAFDQLQKVVMAGNEPQQGQPVPVVQQQTSGQPRSIGQPPQKKSISPQATSKPRSRPERLEDGALVLQYGKKKIIIIRKSY